MPRRAFRRPALAAFIATLTVAALASPAPAAVTLGPPLTTPATVTGGCTPAIVFVAVGPGAPSCTLLGADPAGQWTMQTPRGQWVITRARVRAGANVGPMAFTIIEALRSQATGGGNPAGIICCTVPVESQVFTPAPNTVTQVNVRLPVKNTVEIIDREPIEVVHYLAISTLSPATSPPVFQGAGAGQTSYIAPAIRAGQQRLSDGTSLTPSTPLIQGDYEPDADGDGFGDETQDSCSTNAGIRTRAVAHAAQCPVGGGGGGGTTGAGTGSGGPTTPVGPARPPSALRELAAAGSRAFLPIVCPAGAGTACTGTVTATTVKRLGARTAAAPLKLPSRTFTAAPGATARVALSLPAAARRELARRGRLAVDVSVAQTSPVAARTTARVTIRRLPATVRVRSRRVTVALEDAATASGRATYQLRAGRKVLATRRQTAKPGRITTVRFTLKRNVKRGRTRVTVRAAYAGGATATRSVTLVR